MTCLLYGIGAAKAGTSWLHAYLSGHPEVHVPHVKEMHWFDTAAHGNWARRRGLLAERVERLRRDAKGPNAAAMIDEAERLIALMDGRGEDAAYLAEMSRTGAPVAADITPAYGLLDQEGLARMDRAAPGARWLMVLRDPVARLWSNVSMVAARRRPDDPAGAGRLARRLFDGAVSDPAHPDRERCDYAGTIRRVRQVVPAARLMILFFETLFRQDTLDRLTEFLGIGAHPGAFGRRVLEGTKDRLDEGRALAARAALAPQYDFVAAEVGPPPAGWRL